MADTIIEGRWVTIQGRKVFIKTKQSPMDAYIRQKGGQKTLKEEEQEKEYISYYDTKYYKENADKFMNLEESEYSLRDKLQKVAKNENELNTMEKYIEDYTNENAFYNYGRINGHINSFGIDNVNEDVKNRADIIQKAINGNELQDNIIVYRVVDKNDFKNDKNGLYIQNQGFTSTSAVENMGGVDFIDTYDKVKLKIKVDKGTKGLFIGEDTYSIVNESEILFGLNTRIDIEDDNFDKGIINARIKK